MTTILCSGLDDCEIDEILQLPADFIDKIVGTPLITTRGKTIYYMFHRMKEALEDYLKVNEKWWIENAA